MKGQCAVYEYSGHKGSVTEIARALKVSRTWLYIRFSSLGIKPIEYRPATHKAKRSPLTKEEAQWLLDKIDKFDDEYLKAKLRAMTR